jgi:hypothetical protein
VSKEFFERVAESGLLIFNFYWRVGAVPGASSAFPEHIFQAFDVAADLVDNPLAGAVAAVSRGAGRVLPRDPPLGRRVGSPFAALVHVPRLHQPLTAQALKDFLDRITAHRSNPCLSLIVEPSAKK